MFSEAFEKIHAKVKSGVYDELGFGKFKEDVLKEYELLEDKKGKEFYKVAKQLGVGYEEVLHIFERIMSVHKN